MPGITPPTYGVTYDKTEQDTNAAAIVTALSAAMATNMLSLAAARTALHDYVNSVQLLLRKMGEAHRGSGLFVQLDDLLQASDSCAAALIDATAT